ncbi:MAG: hypothetical protein ACRDHZ_18165 [Ktedonobacteraceae bacterium]
MPDKDEQCTDKIHPMREQSTEQAHSALAPDMTTSPSSVKFRKIFDMPVVSTLTDPPSGYLRKKSRLSSPPVSRALLYFPLTRQVPSRLLFLGMLCYSLLMALGIMMLALSILNNPDSGSFVKVDGSTNGAAILLVSILVLFLMPACSLLCGALFGSWRGMLVSLLSIGGGIIITHFANHLFLTHQHLQSFLPLLGLPVAALVVGLIYERRTHAAWWKSMLTLMLGAAIVSICQTLFTTISTLNSTSFTNAAMASSDPQAFIVELWVGGIGLSLLGILALTFPMAGLEGLLHWRIATHKKS